MSSFTVNHNTNNSLRLLNLAVAVSLWTVIYNVLEGLFCTWFGFEDESLTLFGFGIDSFIEVISGIGILHMVIRLKRFGKANQDEFERTALKITGVAFYILVVGLVISSFYNIYNSHKPETTIWGVVVSLISISMMWLMIKIKMYLGEKLNSEAMLADAACSRVCIYMSVILLVGSSLYYFFQLPYVDSIGTLGLAVLSYREGKECFEKAKGMTCCGKC